MAIPTFRARFRFRVQKKLNLAQPEQRLSVAGREVVLATPMPETDINKSEWLIMNARGFVSEDEATAFAIRLKAAAEVSSVASRLGIDSGVNLPTSGLGKQVRDHLRENQGVLVRDNVHGVDVFQDEPNVRIFSLSATGSVLANAKPFLDNLETLLHAPDGIAKETRDVVLLLNYALMRPEPVAQIVFSVSAVEMLGQQEEWTVAQRQLIGELAAGARSAAMGTAAERTEVAEAIERGVHKLSLRQGVLRLLGSLGLDSLKKPWDALYKERSTLVHGLAPRPGADYGDLAFRTVSLCGRILLKFIAREVPSADAHIDEFYSLPVDQTAGR